MRYPADEGLKPGLLRLAEALARVDDFFGSLGGLPWYQLRCLRFVADAAEQAEGSDASAAAALDCSDSGATGGCGAAAASLCDGQQAFHMPTGVDLENDVEAATRAAAQGLQALPYMAEIYPIGGEFHSQRS